MSLSQITKVKEAFYQEAPNRSLEELEKTRVKYLGKKGSINQLNSLLKEMSLEEKKAFGRELNLLKNEITENINNKKENYLLQDEDDFNPIDIQLPGRRQRVGKAHPLFVIQNEILTKFNSMGFVSVEGPEIEKEYYNFEALNISENHPARDSQDSFYLLDDYLLRTQTSPVQIRTMEKYPLPLAIVSPGRVFRRDTPDASHNPVFHQIEGLYVNQGVNFTHLKGILNQFCRDFFGKSTKLRFRPDYFPFTEPSCEISISCMICRKKGCSTCGGDGWIEILGAGMVNPQVFMKMGIDYKKYTGLAFGVGVERMAMLKYGIRDIRLFYENNLSFLEQF